jgi:hypothetical protein
VPEPPTSEKLGFIIEIKKVQITCHDHINWSNLSVSQPSDFSSHISFISNKMVLLPIRERSIAVQKIIRNPKSTVPAVDAKFNRFVPPHKHEKTELYGNLTKLKRPGFILA